MCPKNILRKYNINRGNSEIESFIKTALYIEILNLEILDQNGVLVVASTLSVIRGTIESHMSTYRRGVSCHPVLKYHCAPSSERLNIQYINIRKDLS